MHTQWPGKGAPGTDYQSFASTGIQANGVQVNRDALLALLAKIGPAIVVTHSQSGPIGWPVADARPDLVKALISVEPGGPPFYGVEYIPAPEWFKDGAATANVWGVTSVPLTFSPPAAKAADLAIERQEKADAPDLAKCWLQKAPARTLPNLAKVQHLVITGSVLSCELRSLHREVRSAGRRAPHVYQVYARPATKAQQGPLRLMMLATTRRSRP